jgi:transposase-like protein
MTRHKTWTLEQKTLALAFAEKHTAQETANKFGLHKSTIYAWRNSTAPPVPPPPAPPVTNSVAEFQQLGDMPRLIEILTMERDLAQQRLDAALQVTEMLRAKLMA